MFSLTIKRFILGSLAFWGIILGQEVKEIEEYPVLELDSYMENKSFHVSLKSTVSKLKNKEEYPIFWEEIRRHYKNVNLADFFKDPENEEFFKYTYVFNNIQRSKLKINLSAQSLVSSPLIDIFQDFSLNIGPDESSVEISFITPGAPEKIDSPLNIMFWREGTVSQGRWILFRAGSCKVYKPPTHIYIRGELGTVTYGSDRLP